MKSDIVKEMKLDALKLAQAVTVGGETVTFLTNPKFELKLKEGIISISHKNDTIYTSLANVVYFK